ncbi:hypothetical protein RRG08_047585 [Elysia crispata]|uniref:Uncharacterized protein n=1 Tax=Elysia crispata TaxID=231223 RepID=A0AAE1CJF9_9GAST|nr:hypothetical protein RRG08_047585 [Elysia crispata]
MYRARHIFSIHFNLGYIASKSDRRDSPALSPLP